MNLTIRLAQSPDIMQLVAAERSAAQLFRQHPDWGFIADAEVMSPQQHTELIQQQQEWLAVSATGEVAGFIAVRPLEHSWHIAELSVAAEWQRQGIGQSLINAVVERARQQDVRQLTLTTFVDVPWNTPYYQRVGFRMIPATQLTAELQQILAHERALGFPVGSRCAMNFTLS